MEGVYLLCRLSPEEVAYLADILAEAIEAMTILEPRGLEHDILWRYAVSREMTAYDASYIALARKHGLTLVTEDKKLRQAAMGIVKTVSLDYVV